LGTWSWLAERLAAPFALINLGPQRLTARTPGLADIFAASPERGFASLTWKALLAAAAAFDRSSWLDDFIGERQFDAALVVVPHRSVRLRWRRLSENTGLFVRRRAWLSSKAPRCRWLLGGRESPVPQLLQLPYGC
jgi:hypothetical protein